MPSRSGVEPPCRAIAALPHTDATTGASTTQIYVYDPVMGDNGKMYVPKELLPVYKDVLVPLADILTPNQFEIELLTGCWINTIDDDWKACEMLSSSNLGNNSNLLTLASSRVGAGIKLSTEIPKLSTSFVGSGDLFACLFLAWSYKTNNNIKVASEKTIATLQRVLKRTE
ncbi:pyridoxal kinase [Holotrichia oblita]|uniref:Pyridoxal kinase n=1 Tax=Holotrichia oblita TaxID=644536 RepID=A0ACB9TDV9_HOLOL|nr:pyridoxal kinase [Holotrichia oblita]